MDHDLVVGKVICGHDAAVLRQGINDCLGDLALVEAVCAFIGDLLKRLCEIRVRDHVARLIGQAHFIPVDFLHFRELHRRLIGIRDRVRAVLGDREALCRDADRGLHDFLTGQIAGAVVLEQVEKAGNFAGHTGGKAAL